MSPTSDWSGDLLATTLSAVPALTLSFYPFGVMLRKPEGLAVSQYPVDPSHVNAALSVKIYSIPG